MLSQVLNIWTEKLRTLEIYDDQILWSIKKYI